MENVLYKCIIIIIIIITNYGFNILDTVNLWEY